MGYTCAEHFCPTCETAWSNGCDRTCGYGHCRVCGDCRHDAPLSVHAPATCDDGNLLDGDGCSSACVVEPGWKCARAKLPDTSATADKCERCAGRPGWQDALGFDCEAYDRLRACDARSRETDPVYIGGRHIQTPSHFTYVFAEDIEIRDGRPMLVEFEVAAMTDAHLFLGLPHTFGLEVVIGGSGNTRSLVRSYPELIVVAERHGPWLDPAGPKKFWFYSDIWGVVAVAAGAAPPLDGVEEVVGGVSPDLLVGTFSPAAASQVDRLSVATGWRSSGTWDLRLLSGSASPTFADLATTENALEACCLCGGGIEGTFSHLFYAGVFDSGSPTRRLAADPGGATAVLLGSPTSGGMTLFFQLPGCDNEAGPCVLSAIIVPGWAASAVAALNATTLPLHMVWTRARNPECRLQEIVVDSDSLRWTAALCDLAAGQDYLVAWRLEGGYIQFVDFDVQEPPAATIRSLDMVDEHPKPMWAAGVVVFTGVVDESGVLQYRFYWDRWSDPDTSSIHTGVGGLAGFVNTYAGGGLRDGFRNSCLLGDCSWKIQAVPYDGAAARYALVHERTGECMCRRQAPLEPGPCHPGVFSADAALRNAVAYHRVGRGAPVSETNDLYMSADYRNVASTTEGVHDALQEACSAERACIGFMVHAAGAPFQGSLSIDVWLLNVIASSPASASLLAGGAVFVGVRFGNATGIDEAGIGSAAAAAATGPAALDRSSRDFGLGWNATVAYVKVPVAEACLWRLDALPGDPQEDWRQSWEPWRLVNHVYSDCLCQAPLPQPLTADGERAPPDFANEALAPYADRHCGANGSTRAPPFGASHLADFPCTWTWRPQDARPAAAFVADAALAGGAGGDPIAPGMGHIAEEHGSLAWEVSMDAPALPLMAPYAVPAVHTHAFWVLLRSWPPTPGVEAELEHWLFGGVGSDGAPEACLSLVRRFAIDEPVASCSPADNASADADNTTLRELPGDGWALGLRSCGSSAMWDSGAELWAPAAANWSSDWALLVAVGTGTSGGDGETVFYASSPTPPQEMVFESGFNCTGRERFGGAAWMTYGCTATAFLFDLPRQDWRTCELNVTVDFRPELFQDVESVFVRGREPEVSRRLPHSCHSDRIASLLCVRSHSVDDFALGAGATRVLRVEVTISASVDAFAALSAYYYTGPHLTGRVRAVCAPRRPPPPDEPRGIAMQQVGVVGRTCAGMSVESLATAFTGAAADGDAGGVFVGQAWAWDRALSHAEIDALFDSTRPRYLPLRLHRLREQPIELPSTDFRQTAEILCSTPGCVGTHTFLEVPATLDWSCFLTVRVAITDFSVPTEVVEYIRVGGVTLVTNCWPGRERDPLVYFVCADTLPIPRAALLGAASGVTVAIKISADVNDESASGKRALLDAIVELRCTASGADTQLPGVEEAPAYENATQEAALVGLVANRFGEGPGFTTKFIDKVNDFRSPPRILQLTTDFARVGFDAWNRYGSMFIYAVMRDRVPYVMTQEMVETDIADWDVCPHSHRRRGRGSILAYMPDPIINNCTFEAGIPYTVMVYVDQASPPYGIGGTLGLVNVIGPLSTSPVLTPARMPRAATFVDTDPAVGRIAGVVTILKAFSEEDIDGYAVHLGHAGHAVGSALGSVLATGADVLTLAVASTTLPLTADSFLIYARNSHGLALKAREVPIRDLRVSFTQEPTVLTAPQPGDALGSFVLTVSFELPFAGAVTDIVVVPETMQALVQPTDMQDGLALGALGGREICHEASLTSAAMAVTHLVGHCRMVASYKYSVVVYVRSSAPCPCPAPCMCLGALRRATHTGLDVHPSRTVMLRDTAGPGLSLTCLAGCESEDLVNLTALVGDAGGAYPSRLACAACHTNLLDPAAGSASAACFRQDDAAERHRFWRLAFPIDINCTLSIAEVQFYGMSPSGADGELLSGTPLSGAGLVEIEGVNSTLALAFDGETFENGTAIDIEPEAGQMWIGLDLGNETISVVLWARLFYGANNSECRPSNFTLEWSDDGGNWTAREGYSDVVSPRHDNAVDTFIDVANPAWHNDIAFQAVYFSESIQPVPLFGLTPGSTYQIHCYVVDDLNNSAVAPPLTVRTLCPIGDAALELLGAGGCTACPAGFISTTSTAEVCTTCPAGRYAPGPGDTACELCGAGTFAPPGSGACTDCSPGSFSGVGAGECRLCAAGKASPLGSGTCTTCLPGTKATGLGNGECSLCDPGRYAPAAGSQLCLPCAPGDAAVAAGSSACSMCPAGRFGPGASPECFLCGAGHAAVSGSAECETCLPGTFAEAESELCVDCPGGRFSEMVAAWACGVCDEGTYSFNGSSNCTTCEPGRYSASPGAGDCTPCAAGFYSSGGNQTCVPCPLGSAAPPESEACEVCAAGRSTTPDASSCADCAPGRYSATFSSSACGVCPTGRFAAGAGTECAGCAAGRYAGEASGLCGICPPASFSLALSESCTNCSSGWAAMAGSSACTMCVAGSYASEVGDTCVPCAPGRFTAADASVECGFCEVGHFAPLGSSTCSPCPAGRHSGYASGACAICPPGTSSPEASENCTMCLAGEFAPAGSDSCSNCAPGYYSADEAGECTPCARGRFVEASGSTACDACPIGASAELGSPACSLCEAGRFAPATASPNCTACPPGTATPPGSSGCSDCPAGKFAGEGSGVCTACSAGRYARTRNDKCKLCPSGRSVAAGVGGIASEIGPWVTQPAWIASCNLGYTLDGSSTARIFDGHGATSSGGASKLLFDYPEPQRGEVLDYLFLAGRGASLNILALEIGGDSQSAKSYGTEPSHMRGGGDYSCERGHELWLLGEARQRNPDLLAYALCSTVPAWVGGPLGSRGDFWSRDLIEYLVAWLVCARDAGVGAIDYLGVQNEMHLGPFEWLVDLRQALDLAGFNETRLMLHDVAFEGDIPTHVRNDSAFALAMRGGGIGAYYPCYLPRPEVEQAGLKFWALEDVGVVEDWAAAGCHGRTLNRNFVRMNMTSTIARTLVWSVYPGVSTDSDALVDAWEPWSGHYTIRRAAWVAAHTTHFVKVGWSMLDTSRGSSGTLLGGGSFVTFVPPERDAFVLVVEKLHGRCRACSMESTEDEFLNFVLFGGLEEIVLGEGNSPWAVFFSAGANATDAADPNASAVLPGAVSMWVTNKTHHLLRLPDLVVDPAQASFGFFCQRDAIYTIVSNANLSAALNVEDLGTDFIPERVPFPSHLADNFDGYAIDASPRFFADLGGSWQVAPDPTVRSGGNLVLKQWVGGPATSNAWALAVEPMTIVGANFSNLSLQADVFWPESTVAEVEASLDKAPFAIQSGWDSSCVGAERDKADWAGVPLLMQECTIERPSHFAFDAKTGLIHVGGAADLCVSARALCGPDEEAYGLCQQPCWRGEHADDAARLDDQSWLLRRDGTWRLRAEPELCVSLAGDRAALGVVPCATGAFDPRQRWEVHLARPRRYGGVCLRLATWPWRPPRDHPPGDEHPQRPVDGYCLVVFELGAVTEAADLQECSGECAADGGPPVEAGLAPPRGAWQLRRGGEQVLAAGPVAQAAGAWHRLRLEADGSLLRVSVDEQAATEVLGTVYPTTGAVGLTAGWGEVYFDNFAMSELLA